MVIRVDLGRFNIKGDIDEIKKFSKYGHNFLMTLPDSFGLVIKKIALDPTHTIFESQISEMNTFGDIDSVRNFLLWAYHKNQWCDHVQKVICPKPLI